MHEVFHLPGPGAGIALILGPFVIFLGLLSVKISGSYGAPTICIATFSIAYSIIVNIMSLPVEGKGKFGSLGFVFALVLCGIILDIFFYLLKKIKPVMQLILTSSIANIVLLVFYWLVIFPQTKGLVNAKDVPILLGVCILGASLVGLITIPVSNFILPIFRLNNEEGVSDHVRNP